jgi:hypothetical protein
VERRRTDESALTQMLRALRNETEMDMLSQQEVSNLLSTSCASNVHRPLIPAAASNPDRLLQSGSLLSMASEVACEMPRCVNRAT